MNLPWSCVVSCLGSGETARDSEDDDDRCANAAFAELVRDGNGDSSDQDLRETDQDDAGSPGEGRDKQDRKPDGKKSNDFDGDGDDGDDDDDEDDDDEDD